MHKYFHEVTYAKLYIIQEEVFELYFRSLVS